MTQRPNIVFIMTDQQRRNSLGAYGCRYVSTPTLDELAQRSTVYEHCYCNTPVCTPSRAATLTGKPIAGHGVYNLFDILPQNERLLPYYLRELGYSTALVGKLHVSGILFERDNRNRYDGFDIYELCHEPSIHLDGKFNGYGRWLKENFPDEYERVATDGRKRKFRPAESHFSTWVGERSAEIIRGADADKPFFLMAGFFDPHNPYDHYPPEAAEWLHEQYYEPPIRSEEEIVKCPEGVRFEREIHTRNADRTPEELHEMRRNYFASISFIDRGIKRIIDALRERGIYDNTLIIFTSDHGDMLGDHSLYTKGSSFYEDSTNVPLIVKYPGQRKGERSDRLIQLNDLFATMLSHGGGDTAICPDSLDISGRIKREFAVCEYRGSGKCDDTTYPYPVLATMLRGERYKLNVFYDTGEFQLFDLIDDPHELHDLSAEPKYAALTLEMLKKYLRQEALRDYRVNNARGGRSETPDFANVPIKKAAAEKNAFS